MRFPAQLPHHGFDGKRKFALRAELGTFLFLPIYWVNQIHSTVGTTHQIMVNVCATIAAFGFIVSKWRSEAGGHEEIVSNCYEKLS